jgi:membrane protein
MMFVWLKTRFWPRLVKTYEEWENDSGNTLAASVAYYAVFSLFPLVLILISALGFVLRFSPVAQSAQDEFLKVVAQNTSQALSEQISQAIEQVRLGAAAGGPLGLVFLLWAAISIFAQMETAFDRIWAVEQPSESRGILASLRRALYDRLRAFFMLIGLGILFLLAFVAGTTASVVWAYVPDLPGTWFGWSMVQILLGVGLSWFFFTLIYKILPKREVSWADAVQGGLVAAVLWEASQELLAWLLRRNTYSAYGVLGSLIAILLWIYIGSVVLFLGAEYTQVLWQERAERKRSRDATT